MHRPGRPSSRSRVREGGEAASEIHCEGRARACEVNVCEGSGVRGSHVCGGGGVINVSGLTPFFTGTALRRLILGP